MGGLSKKAFITKTLTNDSHYPALIVNSGNLLFKTDILQPEEAETARIAADGVYQATRKTGALIAGVGSRDLAAGTAFLSQFHQPPHFTWLSLNLVHPSNRQPLFTPIHWQQVNGINIAVLALTDHTAPSAQGNDFLALPWQQSLPEVLAQVEQQADFVLLLSNYSLIDNQEIARHHRAIDLILQSGHAIGNRTPLVVNNTLIAQTETRGKYLGVLNVDWNGHGRWREGQPGAATPDDKPASTYSNRFIALKPSITNDPEVEAIVQQTKMRLDSHQAGR